MSTTITDEAAGLQAGRVRQAKADYLALIGRAQQPQPGDSALLLAVLATLGTPLTEFESDYVALGSILAVRKGIRPAADIAADVAAADEEIAILRGQFEQLIAAAVAKVDVGNLNVTLTGIIIGAAKSHAEVYQYTSLGERLHLLLAQQYQKRRDPLDFQANAVRQMAETRARYPRAAEAADAAVAVVP